MAGEGEYRAWGCCVACMHVFIFKTGWRAHKPLPTAPPTCTYHRWVLRQFSKLITEPGVAVLMTVLIVLLLRVVCRWLVFPGSTVYVTGQIDTELAKRTKRRVELAVGRSVELLQVRRGFVVPLCALFIWRGSLCVWGFVCVGLCMCV